MTEEKVRALVKDEIDKLKAELLDIIKRRA